MAAQPLNRSGGRRYERSTTKATGPEKQEPQEQEKASSQASIAEPAKSKTTNVTAPLGSAPVARGNVTQKKYHEHPQEYKVVDDKTESGKFKDLISGELTSFRVLFWTESDTHAESKTAELNPRHGEALRFTYLKPPDSESAKAQWKLRGEKLGLIALFFLTHNHDSGCTGGQQVACTEILSRSHWQESRKVVTSNEEGIEIQSP